MRALKSLKVSQDAYNSLISIKEKLSTKTTKYSIPEIIIASAVLTEILLTHYPELVRQVLNRVKKLRLESFRGKFKGDIYNTLISEYQRDLCDDQKKKAIEEIINQLLDRNHVKSAEDILFLYREILGDKKFKELSLKILEKKVLQGQKGNVNRQGFKLKPLE